MQDAYRIDGGFVRFLADLAPANSRSNVLVALTEEQRLEHEEKSRQTVVRHAWCQMCGPAKTSCSTLCYVRGGRWLHVEGNPLAGNNATPGSRSLCAKGNAAMQALYDPNRLLYPLKRVGAKGEGKFVRCTGDEALAGIGAKQIGRAHV